MKEIKCVLAGDRTVHKAALTIQFVHNHFIDEYDSTIEDTYRKSHKVDGEEIYFDVLDTAGQSEYSAMRDHYMRTGDVFILCYNVSSRSTFNDIQGLYEQVLRAKDSDFYPMILVGVLPLDNANDSEKRCVSYDEGQGLADSLNIPFFEASPKTRLNVDKIFEWAARIILSPLLQVRKAILENDLQTFEQHYQSVVQKVLWPDGIKALHFAALQSNVKMCQLLLKAGAKVNELDLNEKSPLLYAVKKGHEQTINFLLKSRAEITLQVKTVAGSQESNIRELIWNGKEKAIKCVSVGSRSTHKSAMTVYFIQNHFIDEYDPTLLDSYHKMHQVDEDEVFFDVIDMVGQEEYSTMRDQYMRLGDVFILFYNSTLRSTFEDIKSFREQILRVKELDFWPMVLVGVLPQWGYDADAQADREVQEIEGKYLAQSLGIPFLEASPCARVNINEVFETAARVALDPLWQVRKAILKNDLQTFEQHYKSVIDKPLGPDKKTALHLAAAQGNVQMCQLLLQARASKDVLDADKHTPLFYAEVNRHNKVIKILSNKQLLIVAEEKGGFSKVAKSSSHSKNSKGKNRIKEKSPKHLVSRNKRPISSTQLLKVEMDEESPIIPQTENRVSDTAVHSSESSQIPDDQVSVVRYPSLTLSPESMNPDIPVQSQNAVVIVVEDQESEQYKAEQQAALLDESISPLNEIKIFSALQCLDRLDYGQLTNPTAILHRLMHASCGPLADRLDIRYKQIILQTAVPFIYFTFLHGQHYQALWMKESKRQEYLQYIQEERQRLEERIKEPKEHSHNSYRFVLDMLETVLNFSLDSKRYEAFERVMKQLFQESFLCVSSSILVCAKVAIESGVLASKTSVGMFSNPLSVLGGLESVNITLRNLPNIKKPISRVGHVTSIVKESYETLGTITKVKWYFNSMLCYHYGMTTLVTNTLQILKDELQTELQKCEDSDWHILYAGIESLFSIILHTSDPDILSQAFYGDQDRPGLEYYVDFGDRVSRQTSKLNLKRFFKGLTTLTPDQSWRVREHAIACCLMICACWGGAESLSQQTSELISMRSQIVSNAADLLLERRLHEHNGLVRKTLCFPDYVLKVFSKMQQDYDVMEDEDVAKIVNELQKSWHRHKAEYVEDLRTQKNELHQLRQQVNELQKNDLSSREKEIDEEIDHIREVVGDVDELRAIQLEQLQREQILLAGVVEIQKQVGPKTPVELAIKTDPASKIQETLKVSIPSFGELRTGTQNTPKTLLDEIQESAKKRLEAKSSKEVVVEENNSPIVWQPELSPAERKTKLDESTVLKGRSKAFQQELLEQVDRQLSRQDKLRYPFASALVYIQKYSVNEQDFSVVLASKLKEILFKCVLHNLGMNEEYLASLQHDGNCIKLLYLGKVLIPEEYLSDIGASINEKLRKEGELVNYLSEAVDEFSDYVARQYQSQLEHITKISWATLAEVMTRRVCQYLFKIKFKAGEDFKVGLQRGILNGKDWEEGDEVLQTYNATDEDWRANELIDQIGLHIDGIFYIHTEQFNSGHNKYGYRQAEAWERQATEGHYLIDYSVSQDEVTQAIEKIKKEETKGQKVDLKLDRGEVALDYLKQLERLEKQIREIKSQISASNEETTNLPRMRK